MVLVQKWSFLQLFFLRIIDQENVFYDILKQKNAFLGYKNNKFKKSQNWHFSKGVNPWFWFKNGHFSNFCFLRNIDQENAFYDIPEQKNAFRGYKNKKFRISTNGHFSQWVNPWFWSKKWPFFQLFFLRIIDQENIFYDILKRKNASLGYKNKKFKKLKK